MTSTFRPQRRLLIAGALSALPIALWGCSRTTSTEPLGFEGSDISGTHLGQDLQMVDTQGQLRTLADYQGKVLMIFFGYTQCPDVCPTAMAQAAQAMELLGDQAQDVRVIMISVDPERDTPEVLDAYVQIFDPSFIGLTGTPEQLAGTARSFKAFYAKEPGPTPEQYAMNHASSFYLIDRQGEARALIRSDASPEDMVHDIRLLL
ncbi:SCO family protein [Alcaligenaceae bacterium CGII-47]|nr:SCO family protein [Alcaligenaceae bacterium CGII-47]